MPRKKKKRKGTAKRALSSNPTTSGAVLLYPEKDGTITVREKKTGKVLLSGFNADELGGIFANAICRHFSEVSIELQNRTSPTGREIWNFSQLNNTITRTFD